MEEWENITVDTEDQNRKVARLLETADDILEIYNGAIFYELDITGKL